MKGFLALWPVKKDNPNSLFGNLTANIKREQYVFDRYHAQAVDADPNQCTGEATPLKKVK